MTADELPKITAVAMVDVARLINMQAQTLRVRLRSGNVPGGFKERRFNNRNSRWFIPLSVAKTFIEEEGYDPSKLKGLSEEVRPLPGSFINDKMIT